MAVAQKTDTKMACPGKWKHGYQNLRFAPAVCPCFLNFEPYPHTPNWYPRAARREGKSRLQLRPAVPLCRDVLPQLRLRKPAGAMRPTSETRGTGG